MNKYEWITSSSISTDLEDGDKEDIIEQLVELLKLTGKVTDAAIVEEDILKREAVASTTIDEGIDAPHALTAGVSEFCVSLGTANHQKVYVLIAWNENNTRNLKLLAILLETIKNQKESILAAETSEHIYKILESALVQADLQ